MAVADLAMTHDLPLRMGTNDDPLDSTLHRRLDEIADAVTKKPSLPPWLLPLVLYLIGQLVGSIWWAATMQSDVRYLQQENLKLWQKVETHDLELAQLDKIVHAAVRDAMQDADYVRVERGKER
jgi:hypothetical protein